MPFGGKPFPTIATLDRDEAVGDTEAPFSEAWLLSSSSDRSNPRPPPSPSSGAPLYEL